MNNDNITLGSLYVAELYNNRPMFRVVGPVTGDVVTRVMCQQVNPDGRAMRCGTMNLRTEWLVPA